MKLFINAINLSSAGGLNVALNFLRGLNQREPDDMIVYVAAPRHCGYEALASSTMQLFWLPEVSTYWAWRLYTDYVWIPSLIRSVQPDVVFTMGNFATPTMVRQVVLLHYPHPAYPHEEEVWKRLGKLDSLNVRVRNYVFGQRLKYASVLLVQTETMQERIRRVYPQLLSIGLLPNAYTQLTGQTHYTRLFVREPGLRYLMCLSRYYAHKNIEVLIEVARLIRQRGLPYRILMTIEPAQHRNARRLLDGIRREGLTDLLINLGTVATSDIPWLHGQVDGLVLPTLLESFSATYVDAMHFGVPIFTSRRDFSEGICGDCAYYFDPLAAESIMSAITRGFDDPALMQRNVENGRLRSAALPDWTRVSQIGLDIIRALYEQDPHRSTAIPVENLPG
jgi:glycosyltransferase involved in cell wall biosynthesis